MLADLISPGQVCMLRARRDAAAARAGRPFRRQHRGPAPRAPARGRRTVGLVGDAGTVRARLDAYAAAGLDEIAICPATAGGPGGERALTVLAALR